MNGLPHHPVMKCFSRGCFGPDLGKDRLPKQSDLCPINRERGPSQTCQSVHCAHRRYMAFPHAVRCRVCSCSGVLAKSTICCFEFPSAPLSPCHRGGEPICKIGGVIAFDASRCFTSQNANLPPSCCYSCCVNCLFLKLTPRG